MGNCILFFIEYELVVKGGKSTSKHVYISVEDYHFFVFEYENLYE